MLKLYEAGFLIQGLLVIIASIQLFNSKYKTNKIKSVLVLFQIIVLTIVGTHNFILGQLFPAQLYAANQARDYFFQFKWLIGVNKYAILGILIFISIWLSSMSVFIKNPSSKLMILANKLIIPTAVLFLMVGIYFMFAQDIGIGPNAIVNYNSRLLISILLTTSIPLFWILSQNSLKHPKATMYIMYSAIISCLCFDIFNSFYCYNYLKDYNSELNKVTGIVSISQTKIPQNGLYWFWNNGYQSITSHAIFENDKPMNSIFNNSTKCGFCFEIENTNKYPNLSKYGVVYNIKNTE
jgi:hypothetical protein